jgi:hypothetical protein
MGPLLCSLGLTWPLLSSRHSRPQVLQGPLQNGPFSIAAAWKTLFVTLGHGASLVLSGAHLASPELSALSAAGAPGAPPEWPFLHCCSLENPFCDPGASLGLARAHLASPGLLALSAAGAEWPFLHCCSPEDPFCDPGASLGLSWPQNSHSRCDSVVNSAVQASRWRSKFAFPLRFRTEFCCSSTLPKQM